MKRKVKIFKAWGLKDVKGEINCVRISKETLVEIRMETDEIVPVEIREVENESGK